MKPQQVFECVRSNIERVLKDADRIVGIIEPDTLLNETGLDSLEWAIVVVHLQDSIGVDPFEMGVDGDLQTVGDMAHLYVAGLAQRRAA